MRETGTYDGGMGVKPQWTVREDADVSVLVALALRQQLGIRVPEELPMLRDRPWPSLDAELPDPILEQQWMDYWNMTVEPRAHTASGPLELVDGFDTLVALPVSGAEELRAAIVPFASDVVTWARAENARYLQSTPSGGDAYRAYASAIAGFERAAGRRVMSFELNVHVLPLAQRGVWWIGALSVAVTDTLRRDVVGFDAAIRPIIGELA